MSQEKRLLPGQLSRVFSGDDAPGSAHGVVDAAEVDLAQDVAGSKDLTGQRQASNHAAILALQVAVLIGTNAAGEKDYSSA